MYPDAESESSDHETPLTGPNGKPLAPSHKPGMPHTHLRTAVQEQWTVRTPEQQARSQLPKVYYRHQTLSKQQREAQQRMKRRLDRMTERLKLPEEEELKIDDLLTQISEGGGGGRLNRVSATGTKSRAMKRLKRERESRWRKKRHCSEP